jgi:hypothetical protein
MLQHALLNHDYKIQDIVTTKVILKYYFIRMSMLSERQNLTLPVLSVLTVGSKWPIWVVCLIVMLTLSSVAYTVITCPGVEFLDLNNFRSSAFRAELHLYVTFFHNTYRYIVTAKEIIFHCKA